MGGLAGQSLTMCPGCLQYLHALGTVDGQSALKCLQQSGMSVERNAIAMDLPWLAAGEAVDGSGLVVRVATFGVVAKTRAFLMARGRKGSVQILAKGGRRDRLGASPTVGTCVAVTHCEEFLYRGDRPFCQSAGVSVCSGRCSIGTGYKWKLYKRRASNERRTVTVVGDGTWRVVGCPFWPRQTKRLKTMGICISI